MAPEFVACCLLLVACSGSVLLHGGSFLIFPVLSFLLCCAFPFVVYSDNIFFYCVVVVECMFASMCDHMLDFLFIL